MLHGFTMTFIVFFLKKNTLNFNVIDLRPSKRGQKKKTCKNLRGLSGILIQSYNPSSPYCLIVKLAVDLIPNIQLPLLMMMLMWLTMMIMIFPVMMMTHSFSLFDFLFLQFRYTKLVTIRIDLVFSFSITFYLIVFNDRYHVFAFYTTNDKHTPLCDFVSLN